MQKSATFSPTSQPLSDQALDTDASRPPSSRDKKRSSTFSHHPKFHIRSRHGSRAKNSSISALTGPFLPYTSRRDGPSNSASNSRLNSPTRDTAPPKKHTAHLEPISSHDPHTPLSNYPPQARLLPPDTTLTPSALSSLRSSNAASASYLSARLSSLNAKAHKETQRLDSAYYALLTQVSTLTSLVTQLQSLHSTILAGRAEFTTATSDLSAQTQKVVDSYAGFEGQKASIAGLKDRLEKGRKRAEEAEERLAALQGRVEGWEREEEERGRGRQRAFGAAGIAIGVVMVVLLGVLVARGMPGGFSGVDEWGSGWDAGGNGVGMRVVSLYEGAEGEEERARRWREVMDEL